REHASADQLTIALITGWSMPADIWQNQLDRFGRSYHTLAIDPRGQGESQVPANGFTAERRATDLKEFIQPFDKVLLIGWSLGAIESLQYVQMFGADRLAGMVLVDSSVGEEPAPGSEDTFLQALRDDRDKTLNGFVRAIFKSPRTDADVAALVNGAKRMSLENSIAILSYPFPRTHWKEIAHAFRKPLLYIVTPQYAEQAQNLQKNRPETQVEVFKDAGHALFVDEPAHFNELVMRFAQSLDQR
ncbi:MAG TPA: alpha/beta hydrolase, partial [Candidatus Binatus sp.]|nr:alpha/beta hydrolase [Candidatus Binatus sp.]